MPLFYRKSDVKNGKYYKPARFIKSDFEDIEAKELVLQAGDRLDIIAQSEFGNPNYWKALAAFNGIQYFFEIRDGDIIRIPYRIEDVLERM